jgi:hypothetical protein
MTTVRLYEESAPLTRLFNTLPSAPYCSSDKTAKLKLAKSDALNFPYIQINTANFKNWLVFDLDHNNPMIWEDVDLPPPNFTVASPTTNTSHLFYAIPGVATSAKARSAPIRYMKAVYEAMALKLKADLAYSGPVAKTPGHPWWRTHEFHNHLYDLGELSEYVDLQTEPKWKKGPELDDFSHSRNCTLFEITRFFAYAKVDEARRQSSLVEFEKLVRNFATSRNRFSHKGWNYDLRDSDVKATSKSIARWTWDNYRGSSIHRGVMMLPKDLPLPEKQRKSAIRTAQVKSKKSESAIRAAIANLKQTGQTPTLLEIAKATGFSRQTVAKYSALIQSNSNNIVSLNRVLKDARAVKLGVYQIIPTDLLDLFDLSLRGGSSGVFTKVKLSTNVGEQLPLFDHSKKPPD